KTSIFSHPVYLFLREFSLQDFRGGSDRLGVSIRWNGDYVEFSANINARSMRMDNRHSGGFFHGNLLAHFSMNEGGDDGEITFLNGIKVTIAGSATVPEPCFFTGSYHQKADGCFLR
ncbi:hypothetical protein, partial [Escherichia coli]